MNKYLNGIISQICQDVNRGAKPCGLSSIKTQDLDEVKSILINYKCLYKFERHSKEWSSIWIYKREEILDIINLLPDYPKTPADHYILGALFGYSNDAICDFLKEEKAEEPVKPISSDKKLRPMTDDEFSALKIGDEVTLAHVIALNGKSPVLQVKNIYPLEGFERAIYFSDSGYNGVYNVDALLVANL